MYKRLCNNTYDRAFKMHEYIWWNDAFTEQEINNIIIQCEKEELECSTTVGAKSQEDVEQVRKSKVKFFNRTIETDWIFQRLNQTIENINESYYNFVLNGYNSFQFTVYDSDVKGRYDWHMDTTMGDTIDFQSDKEMRKLTAVMLLSEPNVDFTGGEFQLFSGGNIEYPITPNLHKGMIICFPSFMVHRVKPVLLGVRKSLVIWVTGPKFI